jgi:hydroxyethylthiazole kinase-like uncharacterized protein yjeF
MTQIHKLLPTRKTHDNKSAGGKCLIIGGSEGMNGALILSATACSRVGAGYVYVHYDDKKIQLPPDFPVLKKISLKNLKQFNAVAIGPGLKNSFKNKKLIQILIKSKMPNVVLDAGALEMLSEMKIKKLPATWILTPHEKELSRLIKWPTGQIKTHRKQSAKKAYQMFNCLILLKGQQTLIYDTKKVLKIKTGNKALAKAGTGDILTGMVAGFLSQKLSPIDAAFLAASIHGLIADQWVKAKDHLSLMASDINDLLPETLFKLREQKKK